METQIITVNKTIIKTEYQVTQAMLVDLMAPI